MSIIYTGFGSFIAIIAIAYIAELSFLNTHVSLFLIGSFGATAVMLFAAPSSRFARTRNVIGGQVLSALVGVTAQLLLPDMLTITSALAVSLSIMLMKVTDTLHPPGGATALIAVIGGPAVYNLGYGYVISPVLLGTLTMLIVAWTVRWIASNTSSRKA